MLTRYLIVLLGSLYCCYGLAQMTASFETSVNHICNGIDCNYEGPSILINEIMISPTVNDGSLFENSFERQGEWIELYNPDVCEPVDISCYYLGNNQTDGLNVNKGAGFQIPSGTVIPPGGFCVIRGVNAPQVPSNLLIQNGGNVIEIVPTSAIVCMEGIRLWFPNAGGWFAFYDNNGVPQDAVSWGDMSNVGNVPCVATSSGCSGGPTSLASYNSIPADRKTKIFTGGFPDSWGRSSRRMPDGGSWAINEGAMPPTQGTCNDECAQLGSSTCDGTAKVVVAGGNPPYTYQWNDGQAQITQTAIELCTGTYQVQVTDANGEVATFSVQIDAFVPEVTFELDMDLCVQDDAITFTNYSPQAGSSEIGVFNGEGVSGSGFDPALAGVGTHTVSYSFTDAFECTNEAEGLVRVHPNPSAAIEGLESEYCLEEEVIPLVLSPQGGTLTGPGVVNQSFDLLLAGVGTHNLAYVVDNEWGCVDSTIVQVEIFDIPAFHIEKVDSACGDNNGELSIEVVSGTPPFQYSIDGGQSYQQNGSYTNLADGDYAIIVVSADGCHATGTVSLWSFPLPNISVPDEVHVCIGDEVVLETENPDDLPLEWSGGITEGVPFTPTEIGSVTYYVTAELDGCSKTDSVVVTVHHFPPVMAGEDQEICKGDLVTLSGIGAYSYEWSHSVENNVAFTPDETTTYVLTGTDYWGCVNTDSVTITVHPLPIPSFYGVNLEGCQPWTVEFFNTTEWESEYDCLWNFGDGGQASTCGEVEHKYHESGYFDVSLTIHDEHGCVGVDTLFGYVHVFPTPKADFYIDPTDVMASAPRVNFFNTTHGGQYYHWDFGIENATATSTHASYEYPEKEGTYAVTLIAENEYGCIDSIQKSFRVIEDVLLYVPNTFTPDGDQFNQTFMPVFTQGYDYEAYRLTIYNRWGELLFESNTIEVGWDGTYGGRIVQDGSYLWSIEFRKKNTDERHRIDGHVNLLR